MSNRIEIKIDGPKLTPDRFEKAVVAFVTLLKGVAKNIAADSNPDDWTIEVESGSAILRAKTEIEKTLPAIGAITLGFKSLASGTKMLPFGFTKEEVKAVRNLASVVDTDGQFIKRIYVSNGELPITLSEEIVKTADSILTGEKHVEFGSIEGRIETLQGREGYPMACYVVEGTYKRTVVCHFNKKELEDEAIKGFRKRVLVSGLIHYAPEGHPTSIDSDYLKIFPEESELPTVEQIQAIYK